MSTWRESKRRRNIKIHGLDFIGADAIWDNFTVTREDLREAYGEARLVTFGILDGEVVVLVHTDLDDDMHIISLRRAEKYGSSGFRVGGTLTVHIRSDRDQAFRSERGSRCGTARSCGSRGHSPW